MPSAPGGWMWCIQEGAAGPRSLTKTMSRMVRPRRTSTESMRPPADGALGEPNALPGAPRASKPFDMSIRPPEMTDDRPADLQRVDAAGLAVQHLAAGRNHQRVRQRAGPLLVEQVRELVPVRGPHDVVRRRHLLLPQHLQGRVLLVRVVHAERHELEFAPAVHAVERDEL